jgi:multisubunit Na+/H+ antiporter MnhC subunit
MADRLPEPAPPRATYEPVEPSGDVARKNVALALILVGIVILFAAGAVVVSFVYLHFD